MARNIPERTAWFNGELMPESQVRISFRDRGWLFGDTAFDVARTFSGRPFRLAEHVERLYRSLAYLQIDPGYSAAEMIAITTQVVEANAPLLGSGEDYWVGQHISRGILAPEGETTEHSGATIVVDCTPLPFYSRALDFRDGIEVVVPSVRRTPPASLSPNAKMCNYLNMIVGDLEAKSVNARAWAVLLDEHGNLTEGLGSNIFVVIDGSLRTPRESFVLPGVSREVVKDLASQLGIECRETDISLYDAYNAREAFLTSTSLCMCPVRSINGVQMKSDAVPGPITARLMDAFKELVGHDFVAQYLQYLDRKAS